MQDTVCIVLADENLDDSKIRMNKAGLRAGQRVDGAMPMAVMTAISATRCNRVKLRMQTCNK